MTKPGLTDFVESVRISEESLLPNADSHVRFFAERVSLKNKQLPCRVRKHGARHLPKETKMSRKVLLGGFLLVCIVSLILTKHSEADEFPVISAKALKAKMDAGEKLLLLNPLSEIPYNEGHIPGSVHIPLHIISTTDKLPEDKDMLIVTYCLGPK